MATVQQKLPEEGLSRGNGYVSSCKVSEGDTDLFPAGLRVLVVDDDRTCLKTLDQMLKKCLYHVTTCCRATLALSLLREKKNGFDLVISDVHMPDMDGFKLLEHVGLEMDLPVIMMSADGRTSAVLKGIRHGACDYLIKPVRMEELKNIWQHVLRKKWHESKEHENSGSVEDSNRQKQGADDAEYASSVIDGTDSSWKGQKKKRECREDEDDGDLENDDPSTSKKPRVVWSVELHQQFVNAVNQLGIDKAVPKRILELMNVPGLTRENVASHLQKFRLYLKRLSGVSQHQNGHPNTYCGSGETGAKVNPLGRLDFQALAASGQIPPQTLAAALQAELLGQPSGSMMLSGLDQSSLLQTSVPGPKYISVDHGVGFGSQPLVKCSSTKQFPPSNVVLGDAPSGFLYWSANSLGGTCSTNNLAGMNNLQNNNMLPQMPQQKQSQPAISESSHAAVNVQPSCLIIPSQSSGTYQVGNNSTIINPNPLLVPPQPSNSYQSVNSSAPLNQNHSFDNCNESVDYSLVSSQPSTSSMCVGQTTDGHFKSSGLATGFSVAGSISPMPSGLISASADGNNSWRLTNSFVNTATSGTFSGFAPPNMYDLQGPGVNSGMTSNEGQVKNLGFVGKGTCIPSRFAVDDIESPTDNAFRDNINYGDNATVVKQEVELDFAGGGSRGGNAPRFSSSDFTSVISK